ncbi:MAG: peptidase S49, partial [Gammaproteobacteria bacterium]|nr:peptidase S49 [Gammaproteobacteria bacterium]MBU2414858.1 peptidase S49 [Gammaproteobacteria bacterium]
MSWTEDEDRKQSLSETSSEHTRTGKKIEKDSTDPNKEIWSLLEKTLSENLIEKRRTRRWRIFFRFTTLAIFLAVVGGWFAKSNFQ